MVLDSFPPKSHSSKTQTRYGSGVSYRVNNRNFPDTSEFSSVKSASWANKYGVFQEEIPRLADAIRFYTDIHALCGNNCSESCSPSITSDFYFWWDTITILVSKWHWHHIELILWIINATIASIAGGARSCCL